MVNFSDYRLVPLEELVHDQALQDDYLEFLEEVRDHHRDVNLYKEPHEEELALQHIFNKWEPWKIKKEFAKFSEAGFEGPRSVSACVLVRQSDSTIIGQCAWNVDVDREGNNKAFGYDIIRPSERRKGYGRVMLAHRLAQAEEFDIDYIAITNREGNEGTIRRVQRLIDAGVAEKSDSRIHFDEYRIVPDKRDLHQYAGLLSADSQEPERVPDLI